MPLDFKGTQQKGNSNQLALREQVFRGREGLSNACDRDTELGAAWDGAPESL